jgi:hypothetical protein
MERPLEKVDVAQRLEPARRDRIALRAAAMVGHEHERQVGPCRLGGNARHQRSKVGIADGILGQQHEPHVVVDRGDQRGQIATDIALDAGLAQQRVRECRVATAGRRISARSRLPGDPWLTRPCRGGRGRGSALAGQDQRHAP